MADKTAAEQQLQAKLKSFQDQAKQALELKKKFQNALKEAKVSMEASEMRIKTLTEALTELRKKELAANISLNNLEKSLKKAKTQKDAQRLEDDLTRAESYSQAAAQGLVKTLTPLMPKAKETLKGLASRAQRLEKARHFLKSFHTKSLSKKAG